MLFFGQAIDSLYTDDNIYVLSAQDGATMELGSGGAPAPAPGGSYQADLELEVDVDGDEVGLLAGELTVSVDVLVRDGELEAVEILATPDRG